MSLFLKNKLLRNTTRLFWHQFKYCFEWSIVIDLLLYIFKQWGLRLLTKWLPFALHCDLPMLKFITLQSTCFSVTITHLRDGKFSFVAISFNMIRKQITAQRMLTQENNLCRLSTAQISEVFLGVKWMLDNLYMIS